LISFPWPSDRELWLGSWNLAVELAYVDSSCLVAIFLGEPDAKELNSQEL